MRIVKIPPAAWLEFVRSAMTARALPLLLTGALALASPAAADPLLDAPFLSFATGGYPLASAIADLNGDGVPDVVAVNYSASTVSVLLGNGDGTFAAEGEFPTGLNPCAVAVADLNRDGRPDLVVADWIGRSISVLLADSVTAGAFRQKRDFFVGNNPCSLALGDVDGDGALDVVTADNGDAALTVRFSDGLGSFGDTLRLTPGRDLTCNTRGFPIRVAMGDMNGDGKPDLVVANDSSNTVSVLLGLGNGTFATNRDFATGATPWGLALADVSADGRLDVVTADLSDNTVSVFRGNGDGTLGPRAAYPTGSFPMAVVAGDMNGDGRPDLAIANFYGGSGSSASVLLANADGTFAAATNIPTGAEPTSVALGDLNGDGKRDLVTTNGFSDDLSVLLGNGAGGFGTPAVFATGASPAAVAAADLDGDGRPDFVTANAGAGTVSVLLGRGGGALGAKTDIDVGGQPVALAIADLDGDGRPDLAVANRASGAVAVWTGRGDGTFTPGTGYATGPAPSSVAIADVTGDGIPDLVVTDAGADRVSVLPGRGAGRFGPRSDLATGAAPSAVAIGDLDGDGRPDLAVANFASNTVSVLLARGGGEFAPRLDVPAGPSPASVAIGDLNGDGRPDLAVADYDGVGGVTASLLPGRGDGTFAERNGLVAGLRPVSVQIGDLDGDGRSDLVLANSASRTASVLFGDGAGSFARSAGYGTGGAPTAIVIGDWNGDGRADLAATNEDAGSVSLLLSHLPTPVIVPADAAPGRAALFAPAPNPARLGTTLAFTLPAAGRVTLEILDVSGRRTRTLVAGTWFAAGRHAVAWDALDAAGRPAAGGVYFARFVADGRRDTRRIVVLR